MRFWLYLFSFFFINIPYGGSRFAILANFIVILVNTYLIISNINSVFKIFQEKKYGFYLLILLAFFTLQVISIIRTNNETTAIWILIFTIRLLTFFLATISVFSVISQKGIRSTVNISKYIIFVPSIYILVNTIFFLLNIDPFQNTVGGNLIGKSVMAEAWLGLIVDRPTFPLSIGVNTYGLFVGAVFVLNLTYLNCDKKIKKYPSILFFNIVIFFLIIIFVDTRSVVFATFIVFLLLLLMRFIKVKTPYYLVFFISILFPIIIILFSFIISETSLFDNITRTNNDLTTGNNRFFIWGFVVQELFSFKMIHLIGYGELGHYGSQISYQWVDFFKYSYDSPEKAATAHNTILQLILDTGYFGLMAYFLCIFYYFKIFLIKWAQTGNKINLLVPMYIIYINIVGSTEAVFSDFLSQLLFILVFLGGYFLLKLDNN